MSEDKDEQDRERGGGGDGGFAQGLDLCPCRRGGEPRRLAGVAVRCADAWSGCVSSHRPVARHQVFYTINEPHDSAIDPFNDRDRRVRVYKKPFTLPPGTHHIAALAYSTVNHRAAPSRPIRRTYHVRGAETTRVVRANGGAAAAADGKKVEVSLANAPVPSLRFRKCY